MCTFGYFKVSFKILPARSGGIKIENRFIVYRHSHPGPNVIAAATVSLNSYSGGIAVQRASKNHGAIFGKFDCPTGTGII